LPSRAADRENPILDSLRLGDILFYFVFALPFIGVRRYALRLVLSVSVPLAIYYIVIVQGLRSHGSYWDNYVAFRLIVGALCVAHVRPLWEWIRARIQV
jgi:hypothetical protein